MPASRLICSRLCASFPIAGYVATEVIKQLLEKGYNVRGTVRSVAAHDKISHLQKLGEALPGNLELHEADLLKEGSFDEVIEGADYVFHTASPFIRRGHPMP